VLLSGASARIIEVGIKKGVGPELYLDITQFIVWSPVKVARVGSRPPCMGRTSVTDVNDSIRNRMSSVSRACVNFVDMIDAAADCVALDDP